MYEKLPWEARLVGLMGPRGVGKYIFEVGGRKKGSKQVKDVENAYIVRDDTEYAAGEFLPLWSFGLMY